MKSLFSILIAIILGLGIGVLTAYQAISTGWGVEVKQNHGWRIYKNLSSPELSVYAKAYLVTSGHLPLSQDQALYFFTYVDDEGQSLNTACDYKLIGDDMDAFWWSVSAHDTNFEAFENSSHRYSFNMANIIRNADGQYNISISAQVREGNWLPLTQQDAKSNQNFMMSLRLYGIDKKMTAQIEQIALPKLEKMGCES